MTNGHFEFEIEGVKYSLYYGMTAAQIVVQKSYNMVLRLSKENPGVPLEKLKVDDNLAFAYIVYAGLCNYADIKERNTPTFEEAYIIAEAIIIDSNESLQAEIFNCYKNSKATVAQNEKLGIKPFKEDEKKKTTPLKRTGTQSKPMLTER